MEYDRIIGGLFVTFFATLIWAMICIIAIGVLSLKQDAKIEKQIENTEK